MNRADWLAQFITELVVRAQPAVPDKFANTMAANLWTTHGSRDPAAVAREWLKARAPAKP